MLVSLSAYPEFYKKHMKALVAFGPVCTLSHVSNKLFTGLAPSQKILNLVEKMCPEVL